MKQKITIALSFILGAFLIFWACQDDELPEPTPGVSNKIVFTQVNSNSVAYRVIDVSVTIDNVAGENIKEHGICYSTAANPMVSGDKIQQGSLSGNTYSCSIENLEPNTTYHIRAYLKFKETTAYSQDFSFKTNPLETPEVENLGLSFSSGVSLQIKGKITDLGGDTINTKGICWNYTENPSLNDSILIDTLKSDTISILLTSINTDSTYYMKVFAVNSVGVGYSDAIVFSADSLPSITTGSVTSITETGAVCGGTVSSDGGSDVTKRGVCWSTAQNPDLTNSFTEDGTGAGTFTSTLSNLKVATVYYVRGYATNSTGTSYGNQQEFSTTGLPVLTTTAVTNITATTATSGGNITDDGGYEITARGICWGTTTEPTLDDSYTVDGLGTGSYTSNLTELSVNTTYYVRAYATNANGTRYGNEISFSTDNGLAILSTTAVSSVTSTAAQTGGNITNDGGFDITARGVCWSTNSEPTLSDSYTEDGTGTGSFTSNITGLSYSTTYYVRAYATNATGTSYGTSYSFTTHDGTPMLTTTSISNITTNSATSGGNITDAGGDVVTARGVCWSTSSNPTISDNTTSDGSGTGSYTSNITGLALNTTYYVRAYATNSVGTNYGNEISFTTKDGIPTLTTTAVSNIATTTATSGGNIADDGGFAVTARGVCWSTSTNPTTANSFTTDGSGPGSYTSSITGLTINTTYYVRSYATNSQGTTYGNEISFTTKDGIPDITTTDVTNIMANTATSGGNITDDGGYSITARGVCWNTTSNPTISDNVTTDGTGIGSFTSNLTGLALNATYYVRGYATNASGTYYGNQVSFTTKNGIPTLTTTAISNITLTTATSGGNVTDDGGFAITARGVCWNTTSNPTISDNLTTDGTGIGSFTSNLTGLAINTTYYVRAYATNAYGTVYGDEVGFSSLDQVTIDWQKSFGGTGSDVAKSIQQTADGGYIVAGCSSSTDGDVTGNNGFNDYWVIKLDATGNINWQKSFGGTGEDQATSIQQTTDGGYIVSGNTNSYDGDVSGFHGVTDHTVTDAWIVKLDATGNLDWQQCLGGSSYDNANCIQQTTDGYIVAGNSSSTDGDLTVNYGGVDCWVIKLDFTGNIDWQKSLGGTGSDVAKSIQQTADGGYIVAGYSSSTDGDVSGNHGGYDYWFVKLSSTGSIEWQKSLGGSGNDQAYSIDQTIDGGYIVAGRSSSTDGDVTGNNGLNDYWVIKLDATGNINWQKNIGGTSYDDACSIQQLTNGGYIVAGYSSSTDGDVSGNHGGYDYWFVKLSSTGSIEWQKSLGGSGFDQAYSIDLTTDGRYIIAGYSSSTDGDVTGNNGDNDFWVVKLAPE